MTGLDDKQRKDLARIVSTARRVLFGDADRRLRGTYGILPNGTTQPEDQLASEPAVRAQRRTLEGILAHLRADGASGAAAVERLTREVAFTHLNRLLAIRVADTLEVLPPSVRNGRESSGFKQWISDLAPLLATADDTGGYWTYLSQCADELAVDAPALFDPRNPLLALRPSRAALDDIIGLLSDQATSAIWDADDTFGWAYQFFNTKDERQEMRKSSAPRDSRELAVRNQFFTPSYVVRFLVQNTLGRRLMDADPSSALLEQLPLLIDPPSQAGAPVDLSAVKVLDPACGSGHFLLGCYDVLEAAWSLAGVPPAEAAPRIVPCLWGVDIDPRAVQVAQAAIVFRARRACGRAPLPPANIVTARSLPEDPEAWERAQAKLAPELRTLVSAMRSALRDAPLLGTLLKAEQRLAREIRSTVAGVDDAQDDLFATSGIADDAFGHAERAVISSLQRVADATTATPAERLLAAGASDGVRLVEVVRNRYDAVLMNPPFGEPIASTKDYIKAAYPWIPTKDYNVLAAFVGRGVELCKPEGYMGAITSRVGLFIKTFEAWRKKVLLGHHLVALADLGFGVMEEAMVEAAAYVLSPQPPIETGTYIRLLRDRNRPAALSKAVSSDRRGEGDGRVFRIRSTDFDVIPGSPMAYWMSTSIRRLFTDLPRLEGNGAVIRQGLASGDDFRFLRLAWEVPASAVGTSRDATFTGKRWVPFAKGGEYSPYWSDVQLLVDWRRDGEAIRGFEGGVARNTQHYFKVGLTWPRRTNSAFGIRVLPAGCAFGDKGPAVISRSDIVSGVAYLRSRLVQALIDASVAAGSETTSGGASRSYEVGMVQNLPWPFGVQALPELGTVGLSLVNLAAEHDLEDETAHFFEEPAFHAARSMQVLAEERQRRREDRALKMLALSQEAEELVFERLAIDEAGRRFLDEEQAPHPNSYPADGVEDVERAVRYLGAPMEKVIEEVVGDKGGSRAVANLTYVGDRRLEVLAHALGVHPKGLVELRREHGVLSPDEPASTARDLLSWLVGMAFGRWDARGARDLGAFDPVQPLPTTPPAMLVADDGLPTTEAPAGYPLGLPPDGLLLDQEHHPLDLTSAVEAAADVVLRGSGSLVEEAVKVLGRRSLRDYLGRAFFKDHLGRYSRSRRQAPVYWQLTVPSGAWSAWVYAPSFGREMMYALATHADQRVALASERVRTLSQDGSLSSRDRVAVLDQERTIAAEVAELGDDVQRLAASRWDPDPNDGFVLCAAPLARWFPRNTWKQLDEQLAAIRDGAYPWATVHRYREVL